MKRIFAAIKIHPTDLFLDVYNDLKSSLEREKIKWVEQNNLHLTLKFFGETDENKVIEINSVLASVSSKHRSLRLKLHNVGIFGSSYNPRVIWIGIEKNSELEKLADDLLEKLAKIGFEKDRQNFVPHLTIGRIKTIENKKQFQEIIGKYKSVELHEEEVNGFSLYESILKPAGPEYKILETYPLSH